MPDGASHFRILYIDDDAALVRLVERYFTRRGMLVVHAGGIEQALVLLDEQEFDVIALDHYLPEGEGLQLIPRLSERSRAPPVVYVTGSADMNVAVAALKSGAADFVPKSVGEDFLELLRSAIEQSLEKARLKAEKEAAELEVRAARDRAQMLVREVNHRVANSLALVGAMVRLQMSAVSDEAGRTALSEMQNRLYAVAMVHERLYTSDSVGTVELHDYLSGLLDYLRTTLDDQRGGNTLRVELVRLICATDFAVNLGIVVTEWVTNAAKYAYPTGPGEIRVRLKSLPNNLAELTVEDDGVGVGAGSSIKGTGMGTKLVRAMAQSMAGTIEMATSRSGSVFRLIFPLARTAVRSDVRTT